MLYFNRANSIYLLRVELPNDKELEMLFPLGYSIVVTGAVTATLFTRTEHILD